jgi:hypothetical protein
MARTHLARRIRRAAAAARREAAAPLRPRPAVLAASRVAWARAHRRLSWWRAAYLALVGLCLGLAAQRPLFWGPLVAWLLAGALATILDTLYELDARERRRRHATSATPLLAAGYRLRPGALPLDPELADAIDLLAWLHGHAELVTRPVRGHHRGATRVTYRQGLRALARAWAHARGRPLRHGERVLAALEQRGLVRRVRLAQVDAYRLAQASLEDGLRALELGAGRPLVDWALGPAEVALDARPGDPARA